MLVVGGSADRNLVQHVRQFFDDVIANKSITSFSSATSESSAASGRFQATSRNQATSPSHASNHLPTLARRWQLPGGSCLLDEVLYLLSLLNNGKDLPASR